MASTSTRVGTRISSRVNKLAGRKIADRDTIQQICDNTSARKLMTWLDTVLQDEALTEAEYELWEEMEAGQIEDLFSPEDGKLPGMRTEKNALEAEIAALEQELVESEERESVYAKQHNILSDQAQRSRDLANKADSRLGSGDSIKATAAGKVLQHRYEKQLDSLQTIVQEHISLHEQDKQAATFLSSLPFEDYVSSEVEFTRALGRYSEKLFFPGISSVPGNPRDCALVGLEGKENRYSQGGGYKKVKDTVRRVKSTYLANQEEGITESLNLAASQAKAAALKTLISDLTHDKFPRDEATLSRMAEEYSIRAVKKEHDLQLRWRNEGLPLVEQLKNLQV